MEIVYLVEELNKILNELEMLECDKIKIKEIKEKCFSVRDKLNSIIYECPTDDTETTT